ncbi:MAG: hypothetical protein GY928_18105 [Colwellia sp.]|nr:hypothetical protein [Colwellia sp.]
MLISEFLNTDQLEDIENNQVEELIIECLSKIHAVYGFNDGWNNPDEWMFDELNEKEKELSGIKADEFITSINKSFFEMSGSVMMTMYQPKTLFQYKKRPLFKINEITITNSNYRITPLLLAMRDLTRVYEEETPDIEVIVGITRLIECYDKIYMMVSLNCLWVCEAQRNVNKSIESKLTEFDKKPVNIIKREALGNLVVSLLLDDESLTVEAIKKAVIGDYNKKLDELYRDDIIDEDDMDNVSPSVMVRWIEYHKNEFDQAED